MNNLDSLIHRYIFKYIRASAQPLHFNAVNALVRSQAEMKAQAIMALIASSAMDLCRLTKIACCNRNMGTDAVTAGLAALETHLEPVTLRA